MSENTAIRDAATILLLRDTPQGPAVLMGQRGASAAFMPSKYVFPGGAMDPEDSAQSLTLNPTCTARLHLESQAQPSALAACALRELQEETGLTLTTPEALRYIFRAITPQGRPRRFDARFFLAPASALACDPDDFSAACDELSHLHWVPLSEARALNLPFITEVVLAELSALLEQGAQISPPDGVPFFDNSGPKARFRRLV